MGNASSVRVNEDDCSCHEGHHVVIVGGGYGGVACALRLQALKANFTLIDAKEFMHHNVAALRAAVNPDFATATLIPFAPTFSKEQFVQGSVEHIDLEQRVVSVVVANTDNINKEDVVKETKKLTYTHLVMATGSVGPFPGRTEDTNLQEALEHYRKLAEEIGKATNIVVIGGGAVGVELVGEIRDVHPHKSITLIHSGEQLLSGSQGITQCMKRKALQMLQSKHINVKLGQRVGNLSELTLDTYTSSIEEVKTDKDECYPSDLLLVCTGLRSASSLIQSSFPSESINEEHRLRVDEFLQVLNCAENVFAIGDCCDFKQEKMAAHAGDQGHLVAENILLSMDDTQRKERKGKKKPYVPRFEGMVVTVGHNGGVGLYNGWNLPSFAVALAKAKGLFVAKYWTEMGQKVPS